LTGSIVLPSFLTARSAYDTVTVCRRVMRSEGDLHVDASRLRFVDPFGIAMLGAAFSCKRDAGSEISLSGITTDAGSYLERMDVFRDVRIESRDSVSERHNRQDSLVELTSLTEVGDVPATAMRLSHAIVGVFPGVDKKAPPDEMTGYTDFERLVEPLQYVLSELLENALTHARRAGYAHAGVWVAAQYFPSRERVQLSVVDNGCGFLGSLRNHPELKNDSHLSAILLAFRPRISCNRERGVMGCSVNQGVGLTTALRIIERANGKMVAVSGNSVHDSAGFSETWARDEVWQGVAIGIEMQRNRLREVRFRELLPETDEISSPPLRFE